MNTTMNTSTQQCDDERIARALRGAWTATDWSSFATHLSTCVDCRIAWLLASDFQGSAGAVPGDEHLVARAARAALAATPRAPMRVIRVAVAAAVTLVVAGAASGAMILHARQTESRRDPARGGAAPKHRAPGASAVHPPTEKPMNTAPPANATLNHEATPRAGAAVTATSSGRRLALSSAALAPAPVVGTPTEPPKAEDAATLLEQAVRARRDGRLQDAIACFHRLQADFPETPAGVVSQVSIGDLLLRVGAPADALAAFQAYLRAAPMGALVPEALAGEARALAALGRETESRATWLDLARRFPSESDLGRKTDTVQP